MHLLVGALGVSAYILGWFAWDGLLSAKWSRHAMVRTKQQHAKDVKRCLWFVFSRMSAQWNVLHGFVSLWKRRPTTWFVKFLTFSPVNSVFFQPIWAFMLLQSQLSQKFTEFLGENVKFLRNHVVGRHFCSLWKHRPTTWLRQILTFSPKNSVNFWLN